MLAVACSHRVTTAAGAAARRCHRPQPAPPGLAAAVRRPGLQGPRFYDWAWIIIDAGAAPAGQRSLLIRRNNTTGELAYYRCYAAAPVPLTCASTPTVSPVQPVTAVPRPKRRLKGSLRDPRCSKLPTEVPGPTAISWPGQTRPL